MIECNQATLAKYEKLTFQDTLKYISRGFSQLISNGLNGVNINSLTQIVALLQVLVQRI